MTRPARPANFAEASASAAPPADDTDDDDGVGVADAEEGEGLATAPNVAGEEDSVSLPPLVFGRLVAPRAFVAPPLVTRQQIRDSIISTSTAYSYLPEILRFLFYCHASPDPDVTALLTEHCRYHLTIFCNAHPGREIRYVVTKTKEKFLELLQTAHVTPLIHVELLTGDTIIDYIATNVRSDNTPLHKSSYNLRISALSHLCRCHDLRGYPTDVQDRLNTLKKGFFNALNQMPQFRRRRRIPRVNQRNQGPGPGNDVAPAPNVPGDQNNNDVAAPDEENDFVVWNQEEGKEPMSPELLRALCKWFLQQNNALGIFAHTYLLLTWNLACRSNSTANIKFADMVWSNSFDCFHILFRHSKTDQGGDDAKYPRHIYSNPLNPIVCPVVSLAFYLSCNFGVVDNIVPSDFLFSGRQQERRFAGILLRTLRQHSAEVAALGYDVRQIGPHSIRKGASTYLTSLPGGPPAAATSLRGGWSMGNTKDRYWKYMETGDQFVGRCLSLLPILSATFACSPAYFDYKQDVESVRLVSQLAVQTFPAPIRCRGMGRFCQMALAALIKAKAWIYETFRQNHMIRQAAQVLHTELLLRKLRDDPTFVVVTYPWSDATHVYTGIPPHVSLLQEISVIKTNTRDMIDNFGNRVQTALAAQGYGPNVLNAEGLKAILDEFRTSLRVEILERAAVAETNANRGVVDNVRRLVGLPNERREDGKVYELFVHNGLFRRVPASWRFPRCTTMLLWRKWWIGDDETKIPPLKNLTIKDVNHLDGMPMDDLETTTIRPGRKPAAIRRKATKTLSDMRYLMELIQRYVSETNLVVDEVTISTVDQMFGAIQERLVVGARDSQKMWTTVVNEQRLKEKAEKLERELLADGGNDGN